MWFICVLEKSHLGAIKSTIMTFLPDQSWGTMMTFLLFLKSAPIWLFSRTKWQIYWSKRHYGANFFLFEPYRGSRGLPLVFLYCFMYFFHFRISGVATYEPSLGPFFGSKEKKPLNPHISKSLLAPIWLFSRTLQHSGLREIGKRKKSLGRYGKRWHNRKGQGWGPNRLG